MVGAIVQHSSKVHSWESGQDSVLLTLQEALLHGGEVLSGD